ncbi:MAG: sodium/proline symporter [Spirochaetia bacterium]|nr:sodium/proline symporter [Spirochaetia bacterium]
MLITFLIFLLFFVIVGISSLKARKKTTLDYLLAEHNIKPWLAALSAVATNNSGYMFIGVIGYTYSSGLSAIWLMIGWILGDYFASLLIHKKLREKTQAVNAHTYPGVLSKWFATDFKKFRFISGIVSLLFMGSYAAAQFNAGSKALHILFNWDIASGAVIGSIIVLLYCFSGGIRASIWTDAAQSIVMIFSMIFLFFAALNEIGSFTAVYHKLSAIEGDFNSLFPTNLALGNIAGPILFIIGWMFAGFGVVGQPHIMVRFMALDSSKNMKKARIYYYSWYIVFYLFATMVGLLSRILIPEASGFDAELALPSIAAKILPAPLAGIILAGIFAATISTADSLILSCSAALTHDIFQKRNMPYYLIKSSTVIVTLATLLIALLGNQSVFYLVVLSWSVLASAFLPVLIIYIFNIKIKEWEAITLQLTSLLVVVIWNFTGLSAEVYEIFPAVVISILIYFSISKKYKKKLAGKKI